MTKYVATQVIRYEVDLDEELMCKLYDMAARDGLINDTPETIDVPTDFDYVSWAHLYGLETDSWIHDEYIELAE